jgi:hypothetical protein
MTSVKIKFRKSTIKNKEGVLYFQLINNRKAKLITTRFRLFLCEWDVRSTTVMINTTDNNRILYLQNLKNGLEAETQQIYDLISVLEKRSEDTTVELMEYHVNNSLNGFFFPFIKYQAKKLKSENRAKTASIYETAQRSFFRFR